MNLEFKVYDLKIMKIILKALLTAHFIFHTTQVSIPLHLDTSLKTQKIFRSIWPTEKISHAAQAF